MLSLCFCAYPSRRNNFSPANSFSSSLGSHLAEVTIGVDDNLPEDSEARGLATPRRCVLCGMCGMALRHRDAHVLLLDWPSSSYATCVYATASEAISNLMIANIPQLDDFICLAHDVLERRA